MVKGLHTKKNLKLITPPKVRTQTPYSIADGVTQSLLSDWVSCRKRAQYLLSFWQSPTPREAFGVGSLWHWLLERGYLNIQKGLPPLPFEVVRDAWWKSEGIKIADPAQAEKYLAVVGSLYDTYWQYWKDDTKKKWVGVEFQFDLNFEGFRLRGMRDGLFEGKKNSLWILESKTSARIDEGTLDDALNFNFQNLFYLVATEAEVGRPVAGVLYNVAEKPGIKFETKSSPNIEAWLANAKELVKGDPGRYFKRFEVTYPRDRVEAFKEELVLKLSAFRDWVKYHGPTWKNEQACITRWNCEFLQACANNSTAGYIQTRELFSELGGR